MTFNFIIVFFTFCFGSITKNELVIGCKYKNYNYIKIDYLVCVFIETVNQFNYYLPFLQFNIHFLHCLVQSKTIVTAKLIISNTQRAVTAIKAVSFIFWSLSLVGHELIVNIDVTLDV